MPNGEIEPQIACQEHKSYGMPQIYELREENEATIWTTPYYFVPSLAAGRV